MKTPEPRPGRMVCRAAFLSALFLVPLVLSSCLGRFVYHPVDKLAASPADWGLAYEDVEFSATDGVRLHGWWIPAAEARAVVLFCHGNAGNVSHRAGRVLALNRLGLSVFLFDYRGFGRSRGRPSEQGTYRDARGAWDLLTEKRGVAPDRILVLGRSLGGAVAAHLATEVRPAGLILDSAFTSIPALAQERYSWVPENLLSSYRYDTLGSLSQVSCPVLVLHSPTDEVAPFAHGQALFEAAPEPRRLVETAGTHNQGFDSTPAWVEAVERFADECAPSEPAQDSRAEVRALVPDAALNLLGQAATETCSICARDLRKDAFAILARAMVPGREIRFRPDCPLVPAPGSLEYAAACLEEADDTRPTVLFRVHTPESHLVGLKPGDLTPGDLLPGPEGFTGRARVVGFAYGDGPGFSFLPEANVLMI
ncbi:MAG: alpha/beta hydrolase, partial [Pseudomonadota bacterium]